MIYNVCFHTHSYVMLKKWMVTLIQQRLVDCIPDGSEFVVVDEGVREDGGEDRQVVQVKILQAWVAVKELRL